MRNLRENEHGLFLWSLEDRQALFLVKKWWMPGYEHTEQCSKSPLPPENQKAVKEEVETQVPG